MPEQIQWITLYNPATQGWHQVPDNPAVIQLFQDRGFETPEDSAARAESEAVDLRGKELDDALEAEGLPKSGTVADKRARLADARAQKVADQAAALDENAATPTEETEGEQV